MKADTIAQEFLTDERLSNYRELKQAAHSQLKSEIEAAQTAYEKAVTGANRVYESRIRRAAMSALTEEMKIEETRR